MRRALPLRQRTDSVRAWCGYCGTRIDWPWGVIGAAGDLRRWMDEGVCKPPSPSLAAGVLQVLPSQCGWPREGTESANGRRADGVDALPGCWRARPPQRSSPRSARRAPQTNKPAFSTRLRQGWAQATIERLLAAVHLVICAAYPAVKKHPAPASLPQSPTGPPIWPVHAARLDDVRARSAIHCALVLLLLRRPVPRLSCETRRCAPSAPQAPVSRDNTTQVRPESRASPALHPPVRSVVAVGCSPARGSGAVHVRCIPALKPAWPTSNVDGPPLLHPRADA
ncbi:hypothetical protein BKA63DRAFT_577920 [Paraphoma chrysanthemicola]|nr:hypothetical protein BKA63DRAFT_577920 [Paraphoma chrysanthemicola]